MAQRKGSSQASTEPEANFTMISPLNIINEARPPRTTRGGPILGSPTTKTGPGRQPRRQATPERLPNFTLILAANMIHGADSPRGTRGGSTLGSPILRTNIRRRVTLGRQQNSTLISASNIINGADAPRTTRRHGNSALRTTSRRQEIRHDPMTRTDRTARNRRTRESKKNPRVTIKASREAQDGGDTEMDLDHDNQDPITAAPLGTSSSANPSEPDNTNVPIGIDGSVGQAAESTAHDTTRLSKETVDVHEADSGTAQGTKEAPPPRKRRNALPLLPRHSGKCAPGGDGVKQAETTVPEGRDGVEAAPRVMRTSAASPTGPSIPFIGSRPSPAPPGTATFLTYPNGPNMPPLVHYVPSSGHVSPPIRTRSSSPLRGASSERNPLRNAVPYFGPTADDWALSTPRPATTPSRVGFRRSESPPSIPTISMYTPDGSRGPRLPLASSPDCPALTLQPPSPVRSSDPYREPRKWIHQPSHGWSLVPREGGYEEWSIKRWPYKPGEEMEKVKKMEEARERREEEKKKGSNNKKAEPARIEDNEAHGRLGGDAQTTDNERSQRYEEEGGHAETKEDMETQEGDETENHKETREESEIGAPEDTTLEDLDELMQGI
ncbi:MAG: hypothetical protein Q9166_004345 [cf. Caloplaca sp. 2 TL-2023]